MTGYVADLSWKSGARAIEKLDRLRSTMAVNVLNVGILADVYRIHLLANTHACGHFYARFTATFGHVTYLSSNLWLRQLIPRVHIQNNVAVILY